jgi:hypothetical protein
MNAGPCSVSQRRKDAPALVFNRRSAMRALLIALVAGVLGMPAMAQGPPRAVQSVCAPALTGYVKLGEGHFVRGAIVDVLVGPEMKVLLSTRTDAHGRFRLPGGRVRKGSEWVLRIAAHGQNTALVTVKIDPACAEPAIRLNAPGGPRP